MHSRGFSLLPSLAVPVQLIINCIYDTAAWPCTLLCFCKHTFILNACCCGTENFAAYSHETRSRATLVYLSVIASRPKAGSPYNTVHCRYSSLALSSNIFLYESALLLLVSSSLLISPKIL